MERLTAKGRRDERVYPELRENESHDASSTKAREGDGTSTAVDEK